jgi:hypothetical protein
MKNIYWKRLIWVVFITLYTGLFFYNCLSPFKGWVVPYVYTMLLIVWLSREYYLKRLFFQSGLLPSDMYNFPLRAAFALAFYAAFIIGIIAVVAWPAYRIKAYPLFGALGIILLFYSIVIRERSMRTEEITTGNFVHFYFSVMILMVSLSLGYGSYFLVLYALVIGLPLILAQERSEEKVFSRFMDSLTHEGRSTDGVSRRNYVALWEKYRGKESTGRK